MTLFLLVYISSLFFFLFFSSSSFCWSVFLNCLQSILICASIHYVGLTCAMFMRDAVEIPCPDGVAGLYIRTRTDQIVKVHFLKLEILAMKGFTYDNSTWLTLKVSFLVIKFTRWLKLLLYKVGCAPCCLVKSLVGFYNKEKGIMRK